MTAAEREELKGLQDLEEVLNSFEQLAHVRRLIELERMDAATKCPVCQIERSQIHADVCFGRVPLLTDDDL